MAGEPFGTSAPGGGEGTQLVPVAQTNVPVARFPCCHDMLAEHLLDLPAGRVQVFLAEDVSSELAALDLATRAGLRPLTLVTLSWPRAPTTEDLVDGALRGLAEAGLGLWPGWYGETDAVPWEPDRTGASAAAEHLEQLARGERALSLPWAKAAFGLARRGRPPLPAGFSSAEQCRQLARVLAPRHLALLLAIHSGAGGQRLLSAAHGADWLARATGAAVAVLVPEPLASETALERIVYGAVRLSPAAAPEPQGQQEEKARLWPFAGRPHPFSPGEGLLAERLARDPELSALFAFNQPVVTTKGNRYTVDLLWQDGSLVVEVDGHNYHAGRYAFWMDRQRDYELLVSGYLVLRIPHDEVLRDAGAAVDKIRDLVRFRRQNPQRGEPS
jgi:very-short-patch-repair endonuclease